MTRRKGPTKMQAPAIYLIEYTFEAPSYTGAGYTVAIRRGGMRERVADLKQRHGGEGPMTFTVRRLNPSSREVVP